MLIFSEDVLVIVASSVDGISFAQHYVQLVHISHIHPTRKSKQSSKLQLSKYGNLLDQAEKQKSHKNLKD